MSREKKKVVEISIGSFLQYGVVKNMTVVEVRPYKLASLGVVHYLGTLVIWFYVFWVSRVGTLVIWCDVFLVCRVGHIDSDGNRLLIVVMLSL